MSEALHVAFDIDDTLVDTIPAIRAHYKKAYGVDVQPKDFYSRDPAVWGVTTHAEAIARVNVFLTSEEFLHIPPFEDSLPVLRDLKERGYTLSMLTGRGDFMHDRTQQWREEYYGDLFEPEVVFTNFFDTNGRSRTKGEVCSKLGAKVLVDDHMAHLLTLEGYETQGVLYGRHPYNEVVDKFEFIHRAPTWQIVGTEVVRIMSRYE